MEIDVPMHDGEVSTKELIDRFREAGLVTTADSWEASLSASSSASGTYQSEEELSHALSEMLKMDRMRTHLLMATLEAQVLGLDPDSVPVMTVNLIDDRDEDVD